MSAKEILRAAAGAALALTAAMPVTAQLASPSTAALGMGDNFTALARGYAAAAWNPAGLGLSGNPAYSLNIMTVRGVAGLDPVTLSELKEYEGVVVPAPIKQQWLNAIRAEGSQAGTGGSDVTWLAVQIGRVGVHASSSARAVSDISPGVAQLLMFGNGNEQGEPQAITLSGSSLDVNAYSTLGVSFGMPFAIGDGSTRISVGATAKYTMGHLLALGQETTGAATVSPIEVNFSFPIVHTPLGGDDEPFEVNSGNGIGLDIGFGYEAGALTLAAAVQNIINTFEWDESLLRYRPATIAFERGSYDTEFDPQPIHAAPAALRDAVADMKFKPSLALGAALRQSPKLQLAADARFGSADGMNTRPPAHVGAGVEYMLAPFLPVRAGAAYVKLDEENAGFQYGAGIGVRLGAFNLAATAAQRSTDLGKDTMVMVSVLSIGM